MLNSGFLLAEMSLGQYIELFVLHCTTTWCQPGLSRGFVDTFQKTWDKQKHTQTDSGVCRVASATKNYAKSDLTPLMIDTSEPCGKI